MTKEEIYEENMRNEYLRTFLTGERQGPYTNRPSMDRPWLQYYGSEVYTRDLPRKTYYRYAKDNNRSEERRVGKECRSRWSPYH